MQIVAPTSSKELKLVDACKEYIATKARQLTLFYMLARFTILPACGQTKIGKNKLSFHQAIVGIVSLLIWHSLRAAEQNIL